MKASRALQSNSSNDITRACNISRLNRLVVPITLQSPICGVNLIDLAKMALVLRDSLGTTIRVVSMKWFKAMRPATTLDIGS